MAFAKATKEQAKLRLALYGPSGSGKTFTALRVATGIGGPIGFIDTERRTARKYSDRFDFEVSELDDKTIAGYCREIREAGTHFNVLIIDSLSHAWQELLEQVDKLAKAKYRGNTWSAWSEGTPQQKLLIDSILNCPAHIIATMRSKTSWSEEKDERTGKIRPVKVGLAPEQGKQIEYEFDMLMELTTEHVATISKDRSGKFQDKIIEKPGEDFGRELVSWLTDGSAAPSKPVPADEADVIRFVELLSTVDMGPAWEAAVLKRAGVASWADMPADKLAKCVEMVLAKQGAKTPAGVA